MPGVPGTVFTITGVGTFLPRPPADADEQDWFQNAPAAFSLEPLVRDYLTSGGDCALDLAAMSAMADSTAVQLSAYLVRARPIRLPSPQKVCGIVVFRYNAPTQVATRFHCVLVAMPDSSVRVFEHSLEHLAVNENFSYWAAGETQYADAQVFSLSGIGRPVLESLLTGKFAPAGAKIANVTSQNAALFCESVIRAAEFATQTIRAPSAIGGAPLTWLVTGTQTPRPIARAAAKCGSDKNSSA